MTRTSALGACVGLLLACGGPTPDARAQTPTPAPIQAQAPPPAEAAWRTFAGTWSVSGQRQTLAAEDHRLALTLQVSGAVVLTFGSDMSRGFRGELIGFDDGRATSVGRWVWTDEHGNRIFGRVEGEPVQTGKKFVGTITGGTGRYAGVEGGFELTWQYVVQDEEGTIQGRTTRLEGRLRSRAVRP